MYSCNLCEGEFKAPVDKIGKALMDAHLKDCKGPLRKPIKVKIIREEEGPYVFFMIDTVGLSPYAQEREVMPTVLGDWNRVLSEWERVQGEMRQAYGG